MISLLQQYLAINTVHPHANYQGAIALFKKQAMQDGFGVQEVILPSGHPVLVITLQGTHPALPALALNHHMDVVPADNVTEWEFPPFEGHVDNDRIYGRGTQDCKGLGVAQYGALQQLKKRGIQPARTIHYLMVPDEERGGFHGTKQFVEHPFFDSLNIGYLLDEGMPSGNAQEILIKVNERTPLQIRVTSSGSQNHASGLTHENAIHDLVSFLSKVVQFQKNQNQLLKSHEAGDLISMQCSSLTTHNTALNVIPAQAQVTLDIRIPSHIAMSDGIALIDAMKADCPMIKYEIVATSEERFQAISLDTPFYQKVANAVRKEGLMPKGFAFEATTDARFYSNRGIQAIGFTPFTIEPNLHGTNECIYINDLIQGIAILHNFLDAFCMNTTIKENK